MLFSQYVATWGGVVDIVVMNGIKGIVSTKIITVYFQYIYLLVYRNYVLGWEVNNFCNPGAWSNKIFANSMVSCYFLRLVK